jgi:hypothetical protein
LNTKPARRSKELLPLSVRIGHSLNGEVEPQLQKWIVAAARNFEQQLQSERALTHRDVTAHLCTWLKMPQSETDAIGDALDRLQVAFDMADNLADRERDAQVGKDACAGYRLIPEAAQHCLPALLIASAQTRLVMRFSSRPAALRKATLEVRRSLSEMVIGQGEQRANRRARQVSGSQGRLLCLPAWLTSTRALIGAKRLAELEAWAFAWGTSWEQGYAYADRRSAHARRRWLASLHAARTAWPTFGPFVNGGALDARSVLHGVC